MIYRVGLVLIYAEIRVSAEDVEVTLLKRNAFFVKGCATGDVVNAVDEIVGIIEPVLRVVDAAEGAYPVSFVHKHSTLGIFFETSG